VVGKRSHKTSQSYLHSLFKNYWARWIERRIPAKNKITLTQRSIFIFPSWQGFVFLMTLFAIFIGGVNYANSLILALTFFLASVGLVAILHTYRNLSGLVIEFVDAQPGFVGEDVVFNFSLHTKDTLRREQIHIGFDADTIETTDINAGSSETLRLFVPADQRGYLKPGRLLVQTFFPFGILRAWTWVDVQARAVVYPKALHGSRPLGSAKVYDCEEDRVHAGGSDDFSGLRRYHEGDSLSRVYWKVLSKGQPLATKEFEQPDESYHWLSLQGTKGSLEQRLGILTYWVLKLSEDNNRFGLILNNQRIDLNRGDQHKLVCLEALALFEL